MTRSQRVLPLHLEEGLPAAGLPKESPSPEVRAKRPSSGKPRALQKTGREGAPRASLSHARLGEQMRKYRKWDAHCSWIRASPSAAVTARSPPSLRAGASTDALPGRSGLCVAPPERGGFPFQNKGFPFRIRDFPLRIPLSWAEPNTVMRILPCAEAGACATQLPLNELPTKPRSDARSIASLVDRPRS